MRRLLPILSLMPLAAFACASPPDMKPLSVKELFQGSAYVAYAEVVSVKRSGETEVGEVRVLEQFKGERLSAVISSSDSCGLSLYPGEKRILFLTGERKGHALAYPWNLSSETVLAKLRAMKQ